jgi:hypothetical protein
VCKQSPVHCPARPPEPRNDRARLSYKFHQLTAGCSGKYSDCRGPRRRSASFAATHLSCQRTSTRLRRISIRHRRILFWRRFCSIHTADHHDTPAACSSRPTRSECAGSGHKRSQFGQNPLADSLSHLLAPLFSDYRSRVLLSFAPLLFCRL